MALLYASRDRRFFSSFRSWSICSSYSVRKNGAWSSWVFMLGFESLPAWAGCICLSSILVIGTFVVNSTMLLTTSLLFKSWVTLSTDISNNGYVMCLWWPNGFLGGREYPTGFAPYPSAANLANRVSILAFCICLVRSSAAAFALLSSSSLPSLSCDSVAIVITSLDSKSRYTISENFSFNYLPNS